MSTTTRSKGTQRSEVNKFMDDLRILPGSRVADLRSDVIAKIEEQYGAIPQEDDTGIVWLSQLVDYIVKRKSRLDF